ncbi:MAG TPA: membrane protein insertase YidC [Kofleriaceae bacterium]|jgi:YidC/Oxa1 family membrane protein insertase
MQETGKRLIVAVALALGVMFVFNMVFPQKDPPKPPVTDVGSGSAAAAGSGSAGVTPSTTTVPEVTVQRGPEQKIVISYPRFTATFSSYGGVLSSYHLSDPRYEKDQTKGELLPSMSDTGAFGVNFARSTFVLPKQTEWVGEKLGEGQVKFTYRTPELELEKVYEIDAANFLVKLKLSVKVIAPGVTDATENLALSVFAIQDPKHVIKGTSQEGDRAWFSSTLSEGKIKHTGVVSVIKAPREELGIVWTGYEHPYLLAAYVPKVDLLTSPTMKRTYIVDPTTGLMRTDILFGDKKVKTGDVLTQEMVSYLGPKNYTTLTKADEAAGFNTQFKETINLGWFSFIGKPLLWLLLKFYAVLGNWGLAIILLTFLVKGVTIYWTTQSMRSMKAMAGLAPQMKVLQEKYKDDRARLNTEMQALYKVHSVNPIAGCLPIVMQMPVWLALYRMLSTAGELYQQPFIKGWINDMTAPDPLHILPVILVIVMFLQARLTPQTGDSRQQKIMQYGMPLGFGVMSFMFPAGLTLYIFTNTCLSALHSVYMNKYDRKTKDIVAKMKAMADAEAAKAEAAKKGTKPAKKKAVIDVAPTETDDDTDDQDGTESSADAGEAGTSNPARPRKKKKRRK